MGTPWSALNSHKMCGTLCATYVAHMFILSHLQLKNHWFSICFPWIPHGEPWESHEF